MKIGIGQMNATVGDLAANRAKILEYANRAERAGVDLVVFPEMAITGYPILDLAFKKDFAEAVSGALEQIVCWSKGCSITLAVGGFEKPDLKQKKGYNSLFFIRDGEVIARQRKCLLPTYDVFMEEIFFLKGTEFPVIDVDGQRVGGTICEDIWDKGYEVKPLKNLKKNGAQWVVNASASPFHVGKAKEREGLVCEQAKTHQVSLVMANLVGGQDDLIFDGRSMVVDSSGKVLARGGSFAESLIVVEPNTTQVTPSAFHWESPEEEIYTALKLGISDYVSKNGFSKVVIGLSGGIDSALVATLASDALGPRNVIGVAMPGPYSSSISLEDARTLAQNLGIVFRVRPISARFRAQKAQLKKSEINEGLLASSNPFKKWAGAIAGLIPARAFLSNGLGLANENLQARLRGEMLMYISNAEGCLVLSTGNKSELAMGYCTLYGDMCGGLGVLADVFKTEVWRLARYRNSIGSVIPERVITRPPSAELGPNQIDEDTLPPYDILDQILHDYIEEDRDADYIAADLNLKDLPKGGHSPLEWVHRVIQKVDQNEYKRRQGAPTLRVSPKAWTGRRMPITNRFRPVPKGD